MIIRKASLADAEILAQAEAICFPEAEAAPLGTFRERLAHYGDHFLLMLEGESLVAFVDGMVTDQPNLTDELYADAKLHKENGAWQMIFGVVTLPQYRKNGHAAELLKRMIAQAKAQGRKGLVLTCKEKLLTYYEKFGFVNEGKSVSEHGNAVWYQMRLTF